MTYLQQEFEDRVILEPGGITPTSCVIWLHGLGADGYDFVPIVPQLRLGGPTRPRFIFPHAPVRPITVNAGEPGRAWYDVSGLTETALEDETGIRESANRIGGYVRAEREGGIAASRILLAGFSQGGALALYTTLHYAEPLVGVLALSSYLPLRASLSRAPQANRSLRILMCHGLYDPVLPLQTAERSREILRESGYSVEWRTYPMQHQVCAEEIADVSRWLNRVLAVRATAKR